jgi:hypothetical protein
VYTLTKPISSHILASNLSKFSCEDNNFSHEDIKIENRENSDIIELDSMHCNLRLPTQQYNLWE